MTTPTVPVRPVRMVIAAGLGLYPICFATSITRVRVASRMFLSPVSARETVDTESRNSAAISLIVIRFIIWLQKYTIFTSLQSFSANAQPFFHKNVLENNCELKPFITFVCYYLIFKTI